MNNPPLRHSGMARVNEGSPATHTFIYKWYEPHLPLFPSGWYSFHRPTHFTILDTVTHPNTNRAQRRLTSLIKTNTLPLRQTTTRCVVRKHYTNQRLLWIPTIFANPKSNECSDLFTPDSDSTFILECLLSSFVAVHY